LSTCSNLQCGKLGCQSAHTQRIQIV
jgi:hypothetical protein